jgi:hypothetical protein
MNRNELIKVLRTASTGDQLLDLADKLVSLVEREEAKKESEEAVGV